MSQDDEEMQVRVPLKGLIRGGLRRGGRRDWDAVLNDINLANAFVFLDAVLETQAPGASPE
jgi:hypothetical protein